MILSRILGSKLSQNSLEVDHDNTYQLKFLCTSILTICAKTRSQNNKILNKHRDELYWYQL